MARLQDTSIYGDLIVSGDVTVSGENIAIGKAITSNYVLDALVTPSATADRFARFKNADGAFYFTIEDTHANKYCAFQLISTGGTDQAWLTGMYATSSLVWRDNTGGGNRMTLSTAGNLWIDGTLTGVSSITMTGALSGITTLSMSGQLTNTLAIGTPPFVITSTTHVPNLNVDRVDDLHASSFVRSDADDQSTGRLTVYGASNGPVYNQAPIEIKEDWDTGAGEAPTISFHYSGAVASQFGMFKGDNSGDLSVIDNPGTGYETLRVRDLKIGTTQFIDSSRNISSVASIACSLGTSINEFSIDGTMAGNSDDAVPTEKAVVTYVAATGGGPGTGTQWDLPVWATTTTLGDSMVSQNSAGTICTIGGSVVLGAGATVGDIDTVMAASPTDAQLLTAQGIQEFIYTHNNIGSGNSDWINCPYEGCHNLHEDQMSYLGAVRPYREGTTNQCILIFSVPLPTTRGGKSLYINGTRVSLSAASTSDRVMNTYIFGMGNTTKTTLDDDATSKQTVALHEDTSMGAKNIGGYDAAKISLNCNVINSLGLSVQYVTIRYYYA